MKNSDSLDDLAIFHTVVREGGFRAAARRLGLAPSKVSTTVARMEAALGVSLLRRTTRSMATTDAGRALADRIGPLLAGLDAARAEVAETADSVRGRLKLNVPGAVMPDVLPSLLAAFHGRHPEVEVEIVVENGIVDIVEAGCDAGIRYDEVLAQDMVSIPIGPRTQQIALAAAPDYLEARGAPAVPRELTEHQAIRYRLPDGPLLAWHLVEGGRIVTAEPISRLILGVNAIEHGSRFSRARALASSRPSATGWRRILRTALSCRCCPKTGQPAAGPAYTTPAATLLGRCVPSSKCARITMMAERKSSRTPCDT